MSLSEFTVTAFVEYGLDLKVDTIEILELTSYYFNNVANNIAITNVTTPDPKASKIF